MNELNLTQENEMISNIQEIKSVLDTAEPMLRYRQQRAVWNVLEYRADHLRI